MATRSGAALDRRVGWRWIGGLALGTLPPLVALAYYKGQVSAESYLRAGARAMSSPGWATRLAWRNRGGVGRVLLGSPSVWLLAALPVFIALMGPAPDAPARRRVASRRDGRSRRRRLRGDLSSLRCRWTGS